MSSVSNLLLAPHQLQMSSIAQIQLARKEHLKGYKTLKKFKSLHTCLPKCLLILLCPLKLPVVWSWYMPQ